MDRLSPESPLRPGDAGRLLAFDIETRPLRPGGEPLDPSESAVYMVSFFGTSGAAVFAIGDDGIQDERQLLSVAASFVASSPDDTLMVGWNTGGFDLPFLDARYTTLQVPSGLEIAHTGDVSKYGTPVFDGTWHGRRHVDICELFRGGVAAGLEVSWSLKPVAAALGLSPVSLDASVLPSYPEPVQRAYSLSDARVVFQMATLAAIPGGVEVVVAARATAA